MWLWMGNFIIRVHVFFWLGLMLPVEFPLFMGLRQWSFLFYCELNLFSFSFFILVRVGLVCS